jgi:hypothetical protein
MISTKGGNDSRVGEKGHKSPWRKPVQVVLSKKSSTNKPGKKVSMQYYRSVFYPRQLEADPEKALKPLYQS